MESNLVHGIHHITAISSSAQKTYDFYTKILGLRLVKKSVNQDDVETYHLFFGNKKGSPGFDLTFFPFRGVPKGVRGSGQVTTISFAVPYNSLKFWIKRFEKNKVKHNEIVEEFGFKRFTFYDFDDQQLELVGVKDFDDEYKKECWTIPEISEDRAIHAFHGATLSVMSEELVHPIITMFGYKLESIEKDSSSFRIPGKVNASYLRVDIVPLRADVLNGAGTVHHIAFAVESKEIQEKLRLQLINMGARPTPVIDRFYFTSVYFRVPAGILFEIATSGPGFTADEEEKTLGEKLSLPPFLEDQRAEIEANLEPILP